MGEKLKGGPVPTQSWKKPIFGLPLTASTQLKTPYPQVSRFYSEQLTQNT